MARLLEPVNEVDHILGSPMAPLTLLEYGDYECAFCARANGEVAVALRHLGGDVRYVFRHLPLTQSHPHALSAALAAEAAAAQQAFWAMHEALFDNQDALEHDDLLEYAERLGLDVGLFEEDVLTQRHLPKVRADVRSGLKSGVNGTPTFFVNGVRLDGRWDAGTLAHALAGATGSRRAHR
jgi:protein-disulfide isomerase